MVRLYRFCQLCGVMAILASAGCQSNVVQRGVNNLAGTIPALYYDQVLDNMARLADDPKVLPYFGVPTQATHTNSRQLSAGYTGETDLDAAKHWLFDKQTVPISGYDQNQEAIQVQPVTNPDKLLLMRFAYRMAMQIPSDPGNKETLKDFFDQPKGSATNNFVVDYNSYVNKHDWYCVTQSSNEAKKLGCYAARGKGGWIYVPQAGMNGFSNFTAAILNIATISDDLLYSTKQTPPATKELLPQPRERFLPAPPPPVAAPLGP